MELVVSAGFPGQAVLSEGLAPTSVAVAEAADLTLVRDEVRSACRALGVEPTRAEDFTLAVNEIVSNAVCHGGGRAVLRIWTGPQELCCEVVDRGSGIPQPFPGFSPPDLSTARSGGMGLWLARQFSDLMEVRTGPTGSTMRLHLALTDADTDELARHRRTPERRRASARLVAS